jgi:Zn-dependent protease
MLSGSNATRLFQFKGITVFLHWSWLLVAVFEIGGRSDAYSSLTWNALEYLSLFVIVTLHEFGHAFACRSVGGRADEILLWPLGGVAIVDPPRRPGATLWSIAAGPLVNVALTPILGGLALLIPATQSPNIHAFLRSMTFVNVGLLLFNLLPVYPLDGGQIVGALLWFVIGRARSMFVTAVIGLAGVVGIAWMAVSTFSPWLGLIALFVARQCLRSIQYAKSLNSIGSASRRTDATCPACHRAPPMGRYWRCHSCGAAFDLFDLSAGAETESTEVVTTLSLSAGLPTTVDDQSDQGQCPACHAEADVARCVHCDAVAPIADWRPTAAVSPLVSALPGVTRMRPPPIPSVTPLVLGVCAAIAALIVTFIAIVAYTISSSAADAESSLVMRYLALVVLGLSLVPGVAAVVFFVRYRRVLVAFDLAVQQFQESSNWPA